MPIKRTVTEDSVVQRPRYRVRTDNSLLMAKRARSAAQNRKAMYATLRRGLGIETKKIVDGGTRNFMGTNTSAANMAAMDATLIRLDPNNISCNILQGVSQHQRVGNKVKLINGTMRLSMFPRPYNTTTPPYSTSNLQVIRVICFYDKRSPTVTPTPAQNGDFFQQLSAAGYTGFTGTMYDITNEVNKDRYHVFWERTYKLGSSSVSGGAAGPGDPYVNNQVNNDFQLYFKNTYSLNKTCVKSLDYNDNVSQTQWRGCWLLVFGVAPIGPANGSEYQIAGSNFQIEWKYVDA